MTRIILARHGETTWNIEGRYQGQEDTPLSERGLNQGQLLAAGLRNVPIDLCISSPLQRSFQTCKFCADLHNLPVATDDRLMEILTEKGYPIARRTVAKYREQLNFPVARLRKEL